MSLHTQNKLKWFGAGSLVIQLKCWLWFLHMPYYCLPQLMKLRCRDWNQGCNSMGRDKLFGWKPAHFVRSNISSFIWVITMFLCSSFVTDVSSSNHKTTMYLRNVRLMDRKLDSLLPLLCACSILLCLLSWAGDYGKLSFVYFEVAFCGSSMSEQSPTANKWKGETGQICVCRDNLWEYIYI